MSSWFFDNYYFDIIAFAIKCKYLLPDMPVI